MSNNKAIFILGWAATFTAICMYFSYIDQISMNFAGHKGSLLQPLMTAINCSLWCSYGYLKPKRDWVIFIANAPGVILGLLSFISVLW